MTGLKWQRRAVVESVNDTGLFRVESSQGKGLAIRFDMYRSLSSEANHGTVEIVNLNRLTRERLSGAVNRSVQFDAAQKAALAAAGASSADPVVTSQVVSRAYVKLTAGYLAKSGIIFEGWTETLLHRHERPDWITEFRIADGSLNMREGTLDRSYAPGTTLDVVVSDLVGAMGIGFTAAGAATLLAMAAAKTQVTNFPKGFQTQGRAYPVLAEIFRVLEIQWSIQNGELLILAPGAFLPEPPIVVSQETGLVGKPRRMESGALEVVSLIDPGFRPGRQIALASTEYAGAYRIETIRDSGDTRGGVWYSTMEVRNLAELQGVV